MNQADSEGATTRVRWWKRFSSDTLFAIIGVVLGGIGTVHSCYTHSRETSTAVLNLLVKADRALSASPPQLTDAEDAINGVLALKPSNPQALVFQGRLLEHQGQLDRAEEIYRRTVGQDPDNEIAHFYLGRLLSATGESVEGIEHLEQSAVLGAESDELLQIKEGDLRLAIGLAYLQADTLEDRLRLARETCREAVDHEGTKVRALLCIGDAHAAEDNFSAAITHYEQAEQLAPESPVVLRKLGWGYRLIGRFEDAIAKLNESLEIERDAATEELLRATRRELESEGG